MRRALLTPTLAALLFTAGSSLADHPAAEATPAGAHPGAPLGGRPAMRRAPAPMRGLPRTPTEPPTAAVEKAPARLTTRQVLRQSAARVWTQTKRAATLPAFFWPGKQVTKAIAHGEPIAGLTPKSAVDVADRIAKERGTGVVIGRLAWELHDIWSIRGAERSYDNLIGEIAKARAKNPKLDAAVSCDPESLGLQLKGLSWEQRERVATAAVLRIGRLAKQQGVPLELDMGTSDAMPHTIAIAHRVVRDLRMPVRLALAARYHSSEGALRNWVALSKETGLKLGVRLVKGSFIESEQPDAINERGPLLEHYKRLITTALENGDHLDVAVASQNETIWQHAQSESGRLNAAFTMHVIRGVNPELQTKMRAAGKVSREYVSYGVDAPTMGATEMLTNMRERRAVQQSGASDVD